MVNLCVWWWIWQKCTCKVQDLRGRVLAASSRSSMFAAPTKGLKRNTKGTGLVFLPHKMLECIRLPLSLLPKVVSICVMFIHFPFPAPCFNLRMTVVWLTKYWQRYVSGCLIRCNTIVEAVDLKWLEWFGETVSRGNGYYSCVVTSQRDFENWGSERAYETKGLQPLEASFGHGWDMLRLFFCFWSPPFYPELCVGNLLVAEYRG